MNIDPFGPIWNEKVVRSLASSTVDSDEVAVPVENINFVLGPTGVPCITSSMKIYTYRVNPLATPIEKVLDFSVILHERNGHGNRDRGMDALELIKDKDIPKLVMHCYNIVEDAPTDHRAWSALPEFRNCLAAGNKYLLLDERRGVLRNELFLKEPELKDTEIIVTLTLLSIACESYFGRGVSILKQAHSEKLIHPHYMDLLRKAEGEGWMRAWKEGDVLGSSSAKVTYKYTLDILDKFFNWDGEEPPETDQPETDKPSGGTGGESGDGESGDTGDDSNPEDEGDENEGSSEGEEEEDMEGKTFSKGDGEEEDFEHAKEEERKTLIRFIDDVIEDHASTLEVSEEEAELRVRKNRTRREYVPATKDEIDVYDYTIGGESIE